MNPDAHTLFLLAGAALFALGLRGVFSRAPLLQRIIAINVMGNGVFLVFITLAARVAGGKTDPVPHAMVLTGIVVAVCATALALTLAERLRALEEEKEKEEQR
ncbi:MAG TPA: Na+/H+ antiporter subunit C [Verrucomicrobiales bacterium]|nr:Na+/H+ antiporter subunit C [Verrucomicrobiales bacterium]